MIGIHGSTNSVMTDHPEKQQDSGGTEQEPGAMSHEEWLSLLQHADSLIGEMEQVPHPELKEKIFELLSAIDRIHREPLWRLVRLFKQGVLEKVVEDPPIRTLMELYDLVPAAEREQAAAMPKVYFPNIPIRVVRDAPAAAGTEPAHWVPAPLQRQDLASGECRELTVDGRQVLLCRHIDEFFALETDCCLDGAPLSAATLNGFTLTCPSHANCQYDIRTGIRLAPPGRIASFPVNIDLNGRVLCGFGAGFSS